jgi:hypothetical protein
MSRYFFRFRSETLLAFGTRLEHQSGPKRCFKLRFEALDVDATMYDDLLSQPNGTVLHGGLAIDMYVPSGGIDEDKARAICERILALMSYSQLAPCYPAITELAYDATSGLQDRPFTYYGTRPQGPEVASLRQIDVDLFNLVSGQEQFLTPRAEYAFQLLRKGLMEKHPVDEFIAYWTCLEAVAPELRQLYESGGTNSYRYCPTCKEQIAKCPNCGAGAGSPSPWSGVFQLLRRDIGVGKEDFKAVRKFRGRLLHGGGLLTKVDVDAFKDRELQALRLLLVFALAAVLRLPEGVGKAIASMKVHRLVIPASFRLLGTLTIQAGDPPPIDRPDLQPRMLSRGGQETYTADPEGKVSVSVAPNILCTGATYSIRESQVWGDERAGISATVGIPSVR